MFSVSKHSKVYLAFLVIVACFLVGQVSMDSNSTSAPDSHDNDICKAMAGNGGANKKILCVGQITKNRLLVVSRDYYVYVLPIESLDDSLGKLYINGSKPEPLKELWPNLAKHERFEIVSRDVFNAFTWVSPKSENYFLMTLLERTHHDDPNGLDYDIDNGAVVIGYRVMGSLNEFEMIGSYMSIFYYAIIKEDKQLKMTTVLKDDWCKNELDCNMTVQTNAWKFVCPVGDAQITIGDKACSDPVEWPMLTGAIIKDKFYLFGDSYVIIFPEEAFKKQNVPVEMKKQDYSSFIQCDGTINVKFDPVLTRAAPVKWGLIAAIILIVVLLLLCCLLCLLRQAFSGKKNKKNSKTSHHSRSTSRAGSKGKASHLPRSTRSKGLVSGGRLSRGGSSKGKMSVRNGGPTSGKTTRDTKISQRMNNRSCTTHATNRSGMKPQSMKQRSMKQSRASAHATDRSRLKQH